MFVNTRNVVQAVVLFAAAAGALGAAIATAGGAAGCLSHGAFDCRTNQECGDNGFCEATGACSFVDKDGCRSGRRYGTHAAGGLSGRCVDPVCAVNPVVRVRAGGAHACLVRENGAVACWGAGADGQLGDGTTVTRSTVVEIEGLPQGANDIALGDRHTCALMRDGTVWCWGANDAGQLGQGTITSPVTIAPPARPAQVPLLTDVIAVAAGGSFTCAINVARTAFCWGRNVDGELGTGLDELPAVPTPQPLTALPAIGFLVARDRHACALANDGRIFCWGSNEQGELGDGTRTSRRMPAEVMLSTAAPMTALAAGTAHTCAIGGGEMWCWGANQSGQLGDGNDVARLIPSLVSLIGVHAVAAAGRHTCAADTEGIAWCWGANQSGQLGEGTTSSISVPVPVTGIEDADDVTVGNDFSCARRRDGTVWCWGDDRLGQLGIGSEIERLTPARTSVDRAQNISAGGNHSCALRPGPDGAATTVCWGDNQTGQLGDGTRIDRPTPVALKISLNAREVSAGAQHTCLRAGDRSVWCWGRGGRGQLGTASMIDVAVPTNVAGVTAVSRVAVGGAHTCALQGTVVWCWGANDHGQLGDGTTESRSTPAVVTELGDVIDIALGGEHTCARRPDGTVVCWGRGTEGQLGHGYMADSTRPVVVAGVANAGARNLTSVARIAAGALHTCAVLANGGVTCWGAGDRGQLGWRSLAGHDIPVEVAGLSGLAVDVVAGDRHTCVRTTTDGAAQTPGMVFCWGGNEAGQLGNGHHEAWREAMTAVAIGGTVAIAAGDAHTCALKSDQSVHCWGANSAGQLGNGAVLQHPTAQPTHVSCP